MVNREVYVTQIARARDHFEAVQVGTTNTWRHLGYNDRSIIFSHLSHIFSTIFMTQGRHVFVLNSVLKCALVVRRRLFLFLGLVARRWKWRRRTRRRYPHEPLVQGVPLLLDAADAADAVWPQGAA
jgi:hypothetical protein